MKIANSSTRQWPQAPRLSTFTGGPRFITRFASLVAFSGVLLTPWVAAAQDDEADAPEASEEADSAEPTNDEEESPAEEEAAPAEEEAAPEAEAAPAATTVEAGAALEPAEAGDTIVVVGYRKSLEAALNKKKRATGQVDAIVAEDMADFPDLNLAESLQRVPGVAITRSNGEGSRITVRGLGAGYTRTRVNGMDARAALNGNASRSFDFNLFASELFNSIVVHKTATAALGEGSLGAVVDLNAARPFDYKEGFTVLAAAQGGMNTVSQAFLPRLTGLVSYKDPDGVWGVAASAAYSKTRLDSEGVSTVRWAATRFRSVNGTACPAPPPAAMPGEPPPPPVVVPPECQAVADAFHARIPRYGYSTVEGDRLGFTGGLQLRPLKGLDVKVDGMYATYDTQTDFRTIEVLFRNQEQNVDLTAFSITPQPDRLEFPNSTLTALSANNAPVRSESYRQLTENDFGQVTLAMDMEFSPGFYANVLGGMSRSSSKVPQATTLMYDDADYNGFSYDFTDDERPVIAFRGPDVTDGTNFTLTDLRDALTDTSVAFDVAELQLHWEALDALKVSFGGDYERSSMDRKSSSRNTTACALPNVNCDPNGDGTNELSGLQGTAELTERFDYPGEVGAGSTTSWAAPSLDGWTRQLGYYGIPARPDYGGTDGVEEQAFGAFLQASGEVPMGDMRFLYDAGVRYVQTHQTSYGYSPTGPDTPPVKVVIDRDPYTDILPSANLALWITDDVVARLAGARVLSRPALGDLSPAANVDAFKLTVSGKNPLLDPTRAWNADLGLEWYFAPQSAVVLAGFVKAIDSFPKPDTRQGTFDSTGQPRSTIEITSGIQDNPEACGDPAGCWEISTLGNGPAALVAGLEAGFQTPFSSFAEGLPIVLKDMGLSGNYTYVDSRFEYDFRGIDVEERLNGLSTHSVNSTLYYDDGTFGLRASLAWRSQYIENGNANANDNLFELNEPPPRLDMSSSYNITEDFQVNLEALNVTNAANSQLVDVDARRRNAYGNQGTTVFLGARYTFKEKKAAN